MHVSGQFIRVHYPKHNFSSFSSWITSPQSFFEYAASLKNVSDYGHKMGCAVTMKSKWTILDFLSNIAGILHIFFL